MSKRLADMTLEELWELFPIVLSSHNPLWKVWASDEIGKLDLILQDFSPVVNHIGSTAIPGIQAKPIVDILVEVPINTNFSEIKQTMEYEEYICMSETEDRISFNKGYTPKGYADKVFHIHVHRIGDHDEIIFRDYLVSHPETALEYETLKQSLLPEYRNNRDGYTQAKTVFVNNVVKKARQHE